MNQKMLPVLTGARAVAALLVVLYHIELFDLISLPTILSPITKQGRASVSFFFMLSGFILTYRYGASSFTRVRDIITFFKARIARVVPLYILAHVLATPLCILFWIFQSGAWWQIETHSLVSSWFAALSGVQVYFFEKEYIFLWNSPGWSVAAELFFYMLFPAILSLVRYLSSEKLVLVLAGLWLIELLICLSTTIIGQQNGLGLLEIELRTYFWPPARIWEFAMGVCIGVLWLRGYFAQWRALYGVVSIIILAMLPWHSFASHPSIYVVYPPIMGVLLVSLAHAPSWAALLKTRVAQSIGEASYALYVFHWLAFIPLVAWKQATTSASAAAVWAVVAAMLFLALLLHLYVEQPVRRWLIGA